jgi:hypothetical protein
MSSGGKIQRLTVCRVTGYPKFCVSPRERVLSGLQDGQESRPLRRKRWPDRRMHRLARVEIEMRRRYDKPDDVPIIAVADDETGEKFRVSRAA